MAEAGTKRAAPKRADRQNLANSRRAYRLMPSRRLQLARLALIWERVWPGLWPALTLAGFFVAVALSDLLPELSGYAHSLILAGFVLGVGQLLRLGFRGMTFPGRYRRVA